MSTAVGQLEVTATDLGEGVDPLDRYRRWRHRPRRFYWEHPPTGTAIAAAGVAAELEAGPLTRADVDLGALLGVTVDDPRAPAPLLVGGFRFDPTRAPSAAWTPFGEGSVVLPVDTVVRRDGRTWHLRVSGADRGDHAATPDRPVDDDHSSGTDDVTYQERVRWALDAIAGGGIDKIVLARSVDVAAGVDEVTLLDRLRHRNPACVTFAVGMATRTFIGATPEMLVRVRHGRVATSAVASTTRRLADPDDDRRAVDALVSGAKERAEHRFVVDDIVGTLGRSGVVIDPVSDPTVMTLPDLHHLHTPISGHTNGVSAARLALALHPSAAVCGTPTDAARDWIHIHEALDRGLYAGPVGYVDTRGDGEFRVALRSALLGDGRARLFAGAGIVTGSVPDDELEETVVKLRPMLDALGAT